MRVLRNRIYYGLKPFLPQRLRIAARGWLATRQRSRAAHVWPIMPGSERPPAGWPGWPNGNKFAVVLTHDVEGPRGLERCRRLMELEMELGFRSSFNFIPEGSYSVSPELRTELTQNGFEVGVHDLRHDGRLFHSRAGFRVRAERINQYLRGWNAVGFRSGFMLHQLDWLHDLEIEYDLSTFDTDPFEPQPGGERTIFPFWVPHPSVNPDHGAASGHSSLELGHSAGHAGGYVELPYTLAQDSTLFLFLREQSAEIWLRKLDWVATHGGMVLVNVHPDYIQFPDEPASERTFEVRHYCQLLEHLRSNYGGDFWQALPSTVSSYVRQLKVKPVTPVRKRICMISYSAYLSDNRVLRYAKALSARGDQVDVISIRRSLNRSKIEIVDGVRVIRLQNRLAKSEQTKAAYLWPLLRFLVRSSAWVTNSHRRQPYDLVHVHNMPDFMVFAAWYPRLTGKPVILDIHDIMPEFFESKFQAANNSVFPFLLSVVERWSASFADHVIMANDLWLERFARRTRTQQKCSVFINHVDSEIFQPRPKRPADGKAIILFPGGLQWHQGVDIAIRALALVRQQLPDVEFHIYGDGNAKPELVALAQKLGLNGSVRFFDTIPAREVARVVAEADLGVVPKRADSFGNEAYSTKIMEFMSVGVPVIVSETRVDRYYFDESIVRFFESGNPDALARQILDLLRDRVSAQSLVTNGLSYAARNCWSNRSPQYLALVDNLCSRKTRPLTAVAQSQGLQSEEIPAGESRI